jgi:hypothetical protein
VLQKAFLVGTHRMAYRAGQPAEILGVQFVTPMPHEPRPCYHVRFEDGKEDFIPLSETHHFEVISEEDMKAGRIPDVVH